MTLLVHLGDDFGGLAQDAPSATIGDGGALFDPRSEIVGSDSSIILVDAAAGDPGEHPDELGADRRTAGVHIALQVATIVAAALTVGLGVFLLVRAAANNSFSGTGDDEATVEPGPEVGVAGDDDGSSSGSRRTSGVRAESNNDGDSSGPAVLASRVDEEVAEPVPAAPALAEDEVAGPDGPVDPLDPDPPVDLTPGELITGSTTTTITIPGFTTTITIPGFTTTTTRSSSNTLNTRPLPTVTSPSTTVATAPTIPSTTSRPSTTSTSASTSAPTTTSTTSAPATTATTTASTTTTSTAPTTESTNTIVTAPPRTLISAPSDGAVLSGSSVDLEANSVIGAAEYCWSFSGAGDAVNERCGSGTSLDLDRTSFFPGSLTITARVVDDGGTVLDSESVTVTIGPFSDALTSPASGDEVAVDRPLLLRSRTFLAPVQYCWTLTQGATSAGPFCDSSGSLRLADDLDELGFIAGSMTITAQTTSGETTVASETTTITLTD